MPIQEPPKMISYGVEVRVNTWEINSLRGDTTELYKNVFKNGIMNLCAAFANAYLTGTFKKNLLYLWKSSIRSLNYDPSLSNMKAVHFRVIAEPYEEGLIQDETLLYFDRLKDRLRFENAAGVFPHKFIPSTDFNSWTGFKHA